MRRLLQVLDAFWYSAMPASRLALLRILIGSYALYYLTTRYSMLVGIGSTSASLYAPVGIASFFDHPLPPAAFQALILCTLLLNVAFLLGWKYRVLGPLFSVLLLWTLCYRNSWSMVYHTGNLVALHALVLGLAPAAEAWSLDARSRRGGGDGPVDSWQYCWPIRLICTVTVATYFLAGVAKVAGPLGWSWASGEAMRSQVAVDALRKELLAGGAPELAFTLYDAVPLFTALGVLTLVLEIGGAGRAPE